jgi:hypothetical protein
MRSATRRFRFYKGNPVKRMRRGPHGLILTLLSLTKGAAGQQVIISQEDWDQYGEWREVAASTMDDLRELATK